MLSEIVIGGVDDPEKYSTMSAREVYIRVHLVPSARSLMNTIRIHLKNIETFDRGGGVQKVCGGAGG